MSCGKGLEEGLRKVFEEILSAAGEFPQVWGEVLENGVPSKKKVGIICYYNGEKGSEEVFVQRSSESGFEIGIKKPEEAYLSKRDSSQYKSVSRWSEKFYSAESAAREHVNTFKEWGLSIDTIADRFYSNLLGESSPVSQKDVDDCRKRIGRPH